MFYKRSVMIALAVVALMTLTAGVAAAHAKDVKFEANGIVNEVGLAGGSQVDSVFEYGKNGKLKSIEISTFGEGVLGELTDVAKCNKPEDACEDLALLLEGNGVVSVHDSVATLKVKGEPGLHPIFGFEIVSGKLKGTLGSILAIGPLGGLPDLVGTTDLKIKSTADASYGCLTIVGGLPNFIPIANCDGTGYFGVLPVLVPVELHIKDTGTFTVSNADVTLNGKMSVIVDSTLVPVHIGPGPLDIIGVPVTTGTIKIKKGKASFTAAPEEHPHGKKGPKGHHDD